MEQKIKKLSKFQKEIIVQKGDIGQNL